MANQTFAGPNNSSHQILRQFALILPVVFLFSACEPAWAVNDVTAQKDFGEAQPDKAPAGESGSSTQQNLPLPIETPPFFTPFRVAIIVALIIGGAAVLALLLAFRDGRRTLIKLVYLTRSMLGVDVGIRGVVQLALYSALPATAVAFTQGYRGVNQKTFDWQTFWVVFLVATLVSVMVNLINSSMTFRRVLSPGAGRVWRAQRKAATAAIIQGINRHITQGPTNVEEVRKILRDLLDVIVLHVRDHRGNFRNDRHEVFANLLLEDGSDLIVVARDSFSHSPQYHRPTPTRYPKATMLCGRAMEREKALSVGLLTHAYPEGPKNKPYNSILAIPLFGAKKDTPYGVLSIDCSRPYFFESFAPGQAENDLENSLQTYTHLITLTLEALVSTDPAVVVTRLIATPPASPPKGGQS